MSNMYIYDESEQALSPFFLLSILLHILLFILYPYLSWDLSIGYPSMEQGGVVQVIHVSAPQPAQPRGTPQAVRPSPPPQPQPKPEPTPPKPKEPVAKQQAEQPQPPKVEKPVEVKEETPTREVVPEERPKVEPQVEEKPPEPVETPTAAERTGEKSCLPAIAERRFRCWMPSRDKQNRHLGRRSSRLVPNRKRKSRRPRLQRNGSRKWSPSRPLRPLAREERRRPPRAARSQNSGRLRQVGICGGSEVYRFILRMPNTKV